VRSPVIAIDGPAGAGKSTVSKRLAARLGLTYLDTGAMYRALALKARGEEDESALAALLDGTEIAFGPGEPQRVLVDGEDVTDAIRTPEVAAAASAVSRFGEVRRRMVARQQALVAQGGVVLEGRDATTVIAPDAEVRVYLTASLEERAQRRSRDFASTGDGHDFDAVRAQIEDRDHRDITRTESPLRVAEGATVVESGLLTIEEVVDRIAGLVP
jgi:cytidylate kinase